MSIDLENIRIDLEGAAAPPANMMEAARLSLHPELLEVLLKATGGRAPTPAELCAFADYQRAVSEVIRETLRDAIRKMFEPLANGASVADLFANAEHSVQFASGGPIAADATYRVGETTTEFVVPKPN